MLNQDDSLIDMVLWFCFYCTGPLLISILIIELFL